MSDTKSSASSQPERPESQCSAGLPGVMVIYDACTESYTQQPNPKQISSVVKYWRGGPDPLDYISMYSNEGDKSKNIPTHWHYISFGLTDLHGDGRVHARSAEEKVSGFGFELTFRLRKEVGEVDPPTWPAILMQSLARYVFQSDNVLQPGDHVSWHTPLDGGDSRIQHMLMTEEPQLHDQSSKLGSVSFIQILGVTIEELKAAQHWNGPGVLELIKTVPEAGGPWLITDMRRGESIFEIDPSLQDKLDEGVENEGSNLSGVSGLVAWEELNPSKHFSDVTNSQHRDSEAESRISPQESEQIKSLLQKGLKRDSQYRHEETDENSQANLRRHTSTDSEDSDKPIELVRTNSLRGVHLSFNAETGSLMPLALRGRLKHGRHFTFKSSHNEIAVTLVSPSVAGTLVDQDNPYSTRGPWLQVLLEEPFIEQLTEQLDSLTDISQENLPEHFSWPDRNLKISVLPDTVGHHSHPNIS